MSSDGVRRDPRGIPHLWSALAGYAALTVILAYPLSVRPATSVVADDPDGHLFIWTLAWDSHAFIHRPFSIFDANIFFPDRRTLAYSENLIGAAVFAAPVLWVTDNPVLAMNAVALLSCVLCGLGGYVLARRIGAGTGGAWLCGLIFAFSPARFFRISQIHLTTVYWIPFALAFLHTYFNDGRRRDLRIALAFVTMQALTSGHGAAFVAIAAGGFILWRAAFGGLRFKAFVRDVGLVGTLLIIPSILIFIPYLTVQREMGLKRDLIDWAPTPQSFLASPTHVHAWILSHISPRVIETASGFLFPGYLPLLLAVAALWWRPAPSLATRKDDAKAFYVLLTVGCVLLAAGPPIGIWPFVHWLPGFNFIRIPARFTILGVLGLAVLASLGFEWFVSRVMPGRATPAALIIGSLLVIEFAAMPIRSVPYTVKIPPADRLLNEQPKPFVVAEVPVFPSERSQTMYMLHSMAHWQKTVHGYSGLRPRRHEELYAAMRGFPDSRSLTSLAQIGVTHVIVHPDLYPPGQWREVEDRLNGFEASLTLLYVAGDGRVYRLNSAAAADGR